MILNYVVWDVSPFIISFPESFPSDGIAWYGLLFALSFVVGYMILMRIFKHEDIPIKVLDQLSTYMVVSTLVGARLGHCLFYEPQLYLANPLDILKIWEGGLASHGAAIGIIAGLYLFSRKNKKHVFWILDRIVIVVALSGLFIRTGNLMNSEIIGDITTLPWGFYFIRAFEIPLRLDPRHPTQIYEALSYFLVFLFLLNYYWKNKGNPIPGMMFSYFLILVFSVRFMIEFIKISQVSFENGLWLNMGQILSIPMVLLGIGIILWRRKQNQVDTA